MALDLYQEQINENLQRLTPTQDVEPGVFANFARGAGLATMKGFAEVARAGSMALAPAAIAEDAYYGTSVAKERFFKWHDEVFGSAVDYWTPKPNEVGVAGEVTGKLLSMLPLIMAGPGGQAAAVGAQTMTTAEDLARKHTDVSGGQAVTAGVLQGAGLAAGIWMPILGQNLVQRVLIGGVAFNVAQGVATRAATGLVLADSKAAKEFEAFDGKALTLDVLLGLAFGGIAHFVPSQRAQGAEAWERINAWAKGLKPSDIDAMLVLREAQHINEDSLPGRPATPADASAHVDRIRQAIDQLASDRTVNVEDIKVSRGALPPDSDIVSKQIVTVGGKESTRITYRDGTIVVDGETIQAKGETVDPSEINRDASWEQLAVRKYGQERFEQALAEETANVMGGTPQQRAETREAVGQKLMLEPLNLNLGEQVRDPRFEVDAARLKAAEAQISDLQKAAQRVRQEEGLPRIEEQRTTPPRDITPLEPIAQARAVGQHIERLLLNTGMQRQEAVANAAIWEAFAKSAYERYGIPPAELLTKYGVDVKRMDSADKLLGALDQRYNQIDTPQFKNWFGDFTNRKADRSKVVGPDGKPLVVYHGSPDATFDVFKDESFFSPNPDIAARYTHPSASSIASSAKAGEAKALYPVFLNIRQPFDTRIPAVRRAFEREFFGKYGNGTPLGNKGLPDWTDARDIAEWINETGQKYDGIIVDEGGFPNEAGGVTDRGISYVPMRGDQVKSAIGNRGTFDPNNPNILFQAVKRPVWADELESVGGKIDPDGTVLVMHTTTKEKAAQILKDGVLRRPDDAPDSYGVYFAAGKGADTAARDYGDGTLVPVRVKASDLNPGDVFPGERLDFSAKTVKGVYRPVAVGEAALAPRTLFQDQPFYSQLTRSIEGLKTTTAPAKGWKDTIKGLVSKGQVKQAEIEATGLNEWLDMQQGKVTKQQVQDYLAQNGVKVEEVVLRDDVAIAWTAEQRSDGTWQVRANGSDVDSVVAKTEAEAIDQVKNSPNLEDMMADYPDTTPGGKPKFSQYQLPGGENYRELLLTLPEKTQTDAGRAAAEELRAAQQAERDATAQGVDVMTRGDLTDRTDRARAEFERQRDLMKTSNANFRSGHFDQPNILAHIRFNERTDAEGKKVLFIEEIQSDWAQKGKKEGFTTRPSDPTALPAGVELYEFTNTTGHYFQPVWSKESGRAGAAGQSFSDRQQAIDSAWNERGRDGVPSAPFVGKTEAWVALSLKRMIRYAAENGFDRVAWTTGEQQAARYDLSKQISKIQFDDNSSGGIGKPRMTGEPAHGTITAWDLNGKQVINKHVAPEELEGILGKDVAKKLLESEAKEARYAGLGVRRRELAGLDLSVGGEGMKAFYDKIVPNIANDVLKKMGGGRVGEVGVDVGDTKRMAVAPRRDGTFAIIDLDANVGSPNEYTGSFATRAEGERALEAMTTSRQSGFDITPALREKAMAGVPLFQGGARGSATSFGQTGQSLIHLFENADKSTFQHETGHVFLEMTRDLANRPDVPEAALQDWATLSKWLKLEGGPITREAHEQFARGWEKFLAEGVAPNEGLKGAFKRFRDWLLDIYKSLTNMDVELNNQVRGVMARMLESQAKDPISKGGLEDPRLTDPEYRKALDMMARESGRAEEGGKLIRDPMTGEAVSRTKWIAHSEWYQRLQQDEQARLPGGRRGVEAAVRKAVMGEGMSVQEKRAVTWMLDEHKLLLDHWNESGANIHPDGDPFEIANLQHAEGIEPTAKNTLDMALIDRARQVDPEALENIPTNSDDATFMAAVREIVDAHKPSTEKTDQGGEEATAQTEHVGPQPSGGAGSPPPPGGAESAGGAAAPNMVAREARTIASENPDMKVRVGTEADGTPVYKSLNDMLDDAELDAKIALEDLNLITVAAECLIGVA